MFGDQRYRGSLIYFGSTLRTPSSNPERRFNVGRSSYPQACGPCLCPCLSMSAVRSACAVLFVCHLGDFQPARRAFTSSNSDVVTVYCCRAGRILAISFLRLLDAVRRLRIVEKASTTSCFFFPWLRVSRHVRKAADRTPLLYMYCTPRYRPRSSYERS